MYIYIIITSICIYLRSLSRYFDVRQGPKVWIHSPQPCELSAGAAQDDDREAHRGATLQRESQRPW